MKHHIYIVLILVLIGCEDSNEDIYRYSKLVTQSKEYPVYLDMSEIGNIQVSASSPQIEPFKIVSNDKYYFVGDMIKGIHVYEKRAASVSYLCFIECKYIKDLELVNNQLICNNFVDLVVLDVSNPLQVKTLYRQKNHFNQFTGYKEYWNIPYVEGKGLVVGTERHVLTGTVTEKKLNLDFTEHDKLYGNLSTKVLPDSWFTDQPEHDKPYIGIIKMGTDQIYTYGKYNSWFISTFQTGAFSVREEDLWSTPRGKYAPPYYYSDAYPIRMVFKDSIIYNFGTGNNSGYTDCILYDENYPKSYHLYFPTFTPVDATYLSNMQAFFILSGQSIWGAFKLNNPTQFTIERYIDYKISTDAAAILSSGNHVITIGNKLSVYVPFENEIKLLKDYSDISGTCYSKTGNILAIANSQGLFLYDINDLENIKLMP